MRIKFESIIDKHNGRDFIICCPGKNMKEWQNKVVSFVNDNNLITIGSNKVSELVNLNYHLFTNNDKYEAYGHVVSKNSVLMLGSHILDKHINKHNPESYVLVDYTDTNPSEPIKFNKKLGRIEGYYRTSGNLSIMICHLMGAHNIYIAGMCGFTWMFDGDVHYYKPEIKRDVKSKKQWRNRYDEPVLKSMDNLRRLGIDFKIITPTIYTRYYDGGILG